MADPIPLEDLVERAQNSINVPGGSFVDAETEDWVKFLAAAFWNCRIAGFFDGFRVTEDYKLVNPDDPDATIPEHELTIITKMAKVSAIEALLLEMPTSIKGKAGPIDGEIQHSAQVQMALLKAARDDFAVIKDELSLQGGSRQAYVIDRVVQSISQLEAACSTWVR